MKGGLYDTMDDCCCGILERAFLVSTLLRYDGGYETWFRRDGLFEHIDCTLASLCIHFQRSIREVQYVLNMTVRLGLVHIL